MLSNKTTLRLALAALLLMASASGADAQGNTTREVTLIELDAAAAKPAVVYRRAGSVDDREIIALSPSATTDDLSRALRVLDVLHARFGPTVDRSMAAAVRTEVAPDAGDPQADTRRQQHGQLMSALKRSLRRQVTGFGNVKALRISVPARKT